MEREIIPDKMSACKQVSCSLVMLLVGLLFCFISVVLAYFTYQSAVGKMMFCTLWTDVPGRLVIFITCYYMASLCGYFPIPRRCRLIWFPEPFVLWKLQSWWNLFRNFCLRSPSPRFRRTLPDSPELPLFREEHIERFYDCSPITRRRSAPVWTAYPDWYTAPVYVSQLERSRNESSDAGNALDESFMTFDSPIGGYIVPMPKGKTKKPRYLSESSLEASNDGPRGVHRVADEEEPVFKEEATTAVKKLPEMTKQDIPPRDQSKEEELSNYPRFPWGLLRNPGGVPNIAGKIHNRNLRLEKREMQRYERREREREVKRLTRRRTELASEARAESGLLTSNDSMDSAANRVVSTDKVLTVPTEMSGPTAERGAEGGSSVGEMVVHDYYVDQLLLHVRNKLEHIRHKSVGDSRLATENVGQAATQKRRLPSQRFARVKSRSHHRTKITSEGEDNIQFKIEINRTDDSNILRLKSPSELAPEVREHSCQIEQEVSTKDYQRSSDLQFKLDNLRKMMQERLGQSSQTNTGASRISGSMQNMDVEAGRQTPDPANEGVDSSGILVSSAAMTPPNLDRVTFPPPKDKSKEDDSNV